jgi:hypothetical protein
MEVSGQLHATAALFPVLICVTRLGWSPRPYEHSDDEKNNPCPCWESNPSRPARSAVTILTELLVAWGMPADAVRMLDRSFNSWR